jgi:hypothetical protein
LCDSEIFEEPIEACELLEMQRTHWTTGLNILPRCSKR